MSRWEYAQERRGFQGGGISGPLSVSVGKGVQRLEQYLNDKDAEGWELVSILPSGDCYVILVMRRSL